MTKIKKIILIIFCILICSNKVFAANGSFTDIWSSGSSGGSSGTPSNPNPGGIDGRGSTGKETYENDGKVYRCYYKHSITNGTSLDINAYDMNGTSLIPNRLKTSNVFPAGTWIGINATEVKRVTWTIDSFKYYEVKKSYSCHYERNGSSVTVHTSSCLQNLNCQNYLNQYGSRYGANSYRTENCTGRTIHGSPFIGNRCKLLYVVREVDKWIEQSQRVSINATITPRNCPTYSGLSADRVRIDNNNIEEEVSPITECRNNAITDIENKAKQRVGYPSNKLEYETSNKYSNSQKVTIDAIKKYPQVQSERTSSSSTGASGKAWQEYEYSPQKVCINVMTSEVKYNDDCQTSITSLKQISNSTFYDRYLGKNVSYWHYFIPLDATSNSEQLLSLLANSTRDSHGNLIPTLTKNQCLSGMENHPTDYVDYIKPRSGNFEGDYSKGESRSNDIKKVEREGGCFVAIVLRFNIDQKFYGEKTKSGYTSLKGYGMYFRQIDINNPFPNGLTSDSYWYGLYNTTTKKVKARNTEVALSTSFNNLTYKAELSNNAISKVKTFNKKYPYTSWIGQNTVDNTSGMNANGTSNFIRRGSTSGIFTKKANTNSFYKLGCGPANKDWSGCS